ncbi:MAG: flavin reductase family protein [Lachnospiraceae bacterium]|nr:flavin reductase family protein [Lachnospiraceae bacterium]
MKKQNWKAGNMLYPVPAVMVSCKAKEENAKPNIITVAWAGTVCSDPVMLSISVRPERHSHDIIEKSGEFVVNLVTESLTKACDWCGVRSGKNYDKFKEMKLHPFISDFMETPAIAESPVNIYCKVKDVLKLGSHDMFLAEVTGVTVDESYMDENGRFDLSATGLIAYSHGEYFTLGKKLGKFGYSVKKNTRGH